MGCSLKSKDAKNISYKDKSSSLIQSKKNTNDGNEIDKRSKSNLDLVYRALMNFHLLVRDSGKSVTKEFLKSCLAEKIENFFKFSCDDILWPYNVSLIGKSHILIVADGASVENRMFYEVSGDKLIAQDDQLDTLFTPERIIDLVKMKYPQANVSVEKLKMAAHSSFRTYLPKKINDSIIIKSGYYGLGDYGNKEIAKVKYVNGIIALQ